MYSKAKQDALNKLTFTEKGHRYTFNGFPVVSVTTIIEPHLPFDKGMPAELREQYFLRGHLVHKLTEKYDHGQKIPWDLVQDADLAGYFNAWVKYRVEHPDEEYIGIEERVFHTKHRFSGTLDRLVLRSGELGVIDIKSGELHDEYGLQTAGYQLALNEGRVGPKVTWRGAVRLKQDGTYQYKPHNNKADADGFLGALRLANWRGSLR